MKINKKHIIAGIISLLTMVGGLGLGLKVNVKKQDGTEIKTEIVMQNKIELSDKPVETVLEILIAELPKQAALPRFIHRKDGRKWHSIKCIIFHHGINRHIFKNQSIFNFYFFIKGIITNHISRKAGA